LKSGWGSRGRRQKNGGSQIKSGACLGSAKNNFLLKDWDGPFPVHRYLFNGPCLSFRNEVFRNPFRVILPGKYLHDALIINYFIDYYYFLVFFRKVKH
jgi:hypothetical protein